MIYFKNQLKPRNNLLKIINCLEAVMERKQCSCSPARKQQSDSRDQQLYELINKHRDKKGSLIPLLHDVQELYGYVSDTVQEKIAKALNIPVSKIYGVLTFYHHFTIKPKGKYNISVCMGTACYVKGAGGILDRLSQKLGIKVGESTGDGMFHLEECRCLGACGISPVIKVNDTIHGRLKLEDVDKIIETYRNMERKQD